MTCNRMDLVSKEVDLIVVLQKLQTVRFIHSLFVSNHGFTHFRENIEGGLTLSYRSKAACSSDVALCPIGQMLIMEDRKSINRPLSSRKAANPTV